MQNHPNTLGLGPSAAPFLPIASSSNPKPLALLQFPFFLVSWSPALFFSFIMNAIHPMKYIQEDLK